MRSACAEISLTRAGVSAPLGSFKISNASSGGGSDSARQSAATWRRAAPCGHSVLVDLLVVMNVQVKESLWLAPIDRPVDLAEESCLMVYAESPTCVRRAETHGSERDRTPRGSHGEVLLRNDGAPSAFPSAS